MSLLAVILALLIEQARPLDIARWVHAPLARFAAWAESRFNAGLPGYGAVAWMVVVLPLAAVAWLVCDLANTLHPVAGLVADVGILYLTMGFRHESHFFTDIQLALRMGELDRARTLIGQWRGIAAEHLSAGEVARLAIEQALVSSHRHVFGVMFWYILLPGAAGAVLYRAADFLARRWAANGDPEQAAFGRFARHSFAAIDWLPNRLTAVAFAIVGDFEDAIYCWRTQAERWPDAASGTLLASGAGALGVRLGLPLTAAEPTDDRPELGLGDEADVDFMQSTVGLVWRALVMWVLVLTLLGIAGWVGS